MTLTMCTAIKQCAQPVPGCTHSRYTLLNASWAQVIVEMDFIWAGDQDVQLVVKPIPDIMFAPEVVSKAIGSLIQLRVQSGPVCCTCLHAWQACACSSG